MELCFLSDWVPSVGETVMVLGFNKEGTVLTVDVDKFLVEVQCGLMKVSLKFKEVQKKQKIKSSKSTQNKKNSQSASNWKMTLRK